MRAVLIGFLLFSVSGCNRGDSAGSSRIRIQVPKSLSGFAKSGSVSAMEVLPTGRKVCWGATIRGSGLSDLAAGDVCALKAGLTMGFVEAGGILEAAVPRGADRRVDLFAFIQPTGSNEPCPNFNVRLPSFVLVNTYAMGFQDKIDMTGTETQVTIAASFPGLSSNIASTAAMPAACTSGNVARGVPFNGHISSGANVVQATSGFKLKAKIGRTVQSGQAVSSTGYKLLVK